MRHLRLFTAEEGDEECILQRHRKEPSPEEAVEDLLQEARDLLIGVNIFAKKKRKIVAASEQMLQVNDTLNRATETALKIQTIRQDIFMELSAVMDAAAIYMNALIGKKKLSDTRRTSLQALKDGMQEIQRLLTQPQEAGYATEHFPKIHKEDVSIA